LTIKTREKSHIAYSHSLDKKLFEIRKNQGDEYTIAHILWECIFVLTSAIENNIVGVEYKIYYELIYRKIIEYGIANYRICDNSLGNHLEILNDLIISRRKKNYS